jgi:membrane associated rhomboid family serine protease
MGIYDRDYTHEGYGEGGGTMRFMAPTLTPAVKWILIINVAVFIPSFLIRSLGVFLDNWFAVYPYSAFAALQPWRLISYQFLHAGIFHVFFNMLVLYFFGPMLEGLWGTKRFLTFYLVCGATGGVVYTILVAAGVLTAAPMVGASGAIYGMLAAGAILFPNLRVYVMGIFSMTLRVLAIVIAAISLLRFMDGRNAGGEAAHLAGMAMGIAWVLWQPTVEARLHEQKKGSWKRKIEQQRTFQAEVDRILTKVHDSGLNSLTRKERNTLKRATQMEQQQK